MVDLDAERRNSPNNLMGMNRLELLPEADLSEHEYRFSLSSTYWDDLKRTTHIKDKSISIRGAFEKREKVKIDELQNSISSGRGGAPDDIRRYGLRSLLVRRHLYGQAVEQEELDWWRYRSKQSAMETVLTLFTGMEKVILLSLSLSFSFFYLI